MLTPSIFFVTIIQIIYSFQVFTQAYVMTRGGPENSTLFLVLYLFRHGFEFFRMGYASAMAWILFLLVLVMTLIQFKLSNRWVFYEAELRR
jgi:multiple sugar transport system permease protein